MFMNSIKMAILPNLIYRFNTIISKFKLTFLVRHYALRKHHL